MKLSKTILAGAIACGMVGAAQAGTIVHITGSTAFRKATVQAIEQLMVAGPGGGTYSDSTPISVGKFRGAYVTSSSNPAAAGNEQNATYSILQGTITGANNPVTVKAGWAGSVGGMKTVKNQITITYTAPNGFMSVSNLAGLAEANSVGNAAIAGLASASYTIDGDGQLAQISMTDASASSYGLSGLTPPAATTDGIVGVIPFEWVANNGVTNPVAIANCSTSSGSAVISTTNTTGLVVGQVVGGPNLNAPNPTITAITPNVSFTVSTTASATASAQAYVAATNGTNPINGITTRLSNALLENGGAYLSQFTGNPFDGNTTFSGDNSGSGTAVYALGRNFDSGTRVSCLAETGVGIFAPLNAQLQPVFAGKAAYPGEAAPNKGQGGSAATTFTSLDVWAQETLFPSTPLSTFFDYGQSGYNSGGDIAGALATPGSVGTPAAGYAPQFDGYFTKAGGWLVAYLGRADAVTACKTTQGPNTAHRILWNGQKDWYNQGNYADGSVDNGVTNNVYNNSAITEGLYTAWSYEHLYYNGASADQITVAGKIANQILTVSAPSSGGLLVGSMNVSRSDEGSVVTHN